MWCKATVLSKIGHITRPFKTIDKISIVTQFLDQSDWIGFFVTLSMRNEEVACCWLTWFIQGWFHMDW